MALFNRIPRNPTILPERYERGLREYGLHLTGQPNRWTSALLADPDMMSFANRDPAAFVELLGRHMGNGVWEGFGAYCLGAAEVVAMIHHLNASGPTWDRIVDGANQYLRGVGIPYSSLKPYLKARWDQSHPAGEW